MSAKRICIKKDQQIFDVDDKDSKVVINSLDYYSLAKIFMLLPIPERKDMEEVCTKWKEACQLAWYDIKEYKCQSSIGRCYDNCLVTQPYLEKILLGCGKYLKVLSLSNVCNSSIMPFVGDHCKNLTSFECEFDNDLLTHNAGHFVQAFTQLNKLKCIKIILESENNKKKTVNILEIINSLPKEINKIHLLSNLVSFRKRRVFVSFKKFINLQKLTVQGFLLDNIILQEISEITTLVYLNFRPYHENHKYPLFDKLVNLEYIDLMTPYIWVKMKNFSTKLLNTILCTCKNLKHLDIPRGRYDVDQVPLKEWLNFQNLEYLGISCNITPDLAITIVEYCKNLKHLRIQDRNHNMDNTVLRKLTELENLECLMVSVFKLHEESIIAISNNCKKIKRLEIPGSFLVPSIDGEPLSSPFAFDEISKLQYLEHLNLSYAENLKDSTIIVVANNCKNLKSLDIRGCKTITETALVALSNLKNLQKLDVSRLDIITDSFLIKLKGLKKLHCNECKNLTNAGIIQVIKNNPDLEEINVDSIHNITIDLVIGADQATKYRTNGIILHIKIFNLSIIDASKSIITSQWLVVENL